MTGLEEYRRDVLKQWAEELISSWVGDYQAWDHLFGEGADEFNEEDWEWIKENLSVKITVEKSSSL